MTSLCFQRGCRAATVAIERHEEFDVIRLRVVCAAGHSTWRGPDGAVIPFVARKAIPPRVSIIARRVRR